MLQNCALLHFIVLTRSKFNKGLFINKDVRGEGFVHRDIFSDKEEGALLIRTFKVFVAKNLKIIRKLRLPHGQGGRG